MTLGIFKEAMVMHNSEKSLTEFGKSLLVLYNQILITKEVPKEWKESIMVVLFKKGDNRDLGNYRTITLKNSIPKNFMLILNRRLYSWV